MVSVSFELFPPKTEQAQQQWPATVERLAALEPTFMSVTCGAGGSGVGRTLESIRTLTARIRTPVAGHLTCVSRSRDEVDEAIANYREAGVRHIVALRGDMPDGAPYAPRPDGYADAIELIHGVRQAGSFEVSVAAYPEPHPDSRSRAQDLDWLARKADAGATRALTQFCFDTDAIVQLRDDVDRAGIALTLVPGIISTTNFDAIERMSQKCGVGVPDWLRSRYTGLEDDRHNRMLVAAIVMAAQVEQLSREGFRDFHFYTLNNDDVVPAVCRVLDIRPAERPVSAA